MGKKAINSPAAPEALGPYSHAVIAGNTLYLSGQIALDPDSMQLVNDSVEAEVNRIFDNIAAVLQTAGASLDDLVNLTVFMTDLSNFETVNEVMATRLSPPYPTRAALEVSALPKGAAVEIVATANF